MVLVAYTQLRLMRLCVADLRLPLERRYSPSYLTPVRVRRGVLALLVELGTPTRPRKPCARSPGRPKGRLSGPARRYPPSRRLLEPKKVANMAMLRWTLTSSEDFSWSEHKPKGKKKCLQGLAR
jgi:hypothetical protein